MDRFCPVCGKERTASDKFCPQCGHPFAVAPAAEGEKKGEPEPLRKYATILAADIKGAISPTMEPEEARETISPTMEKLVGLVYEYGGTLVLRSADSFVAVFGAPKSFENHATRGCLAALAMQKQSNNSLRIGLNSGEVVVEFNGSKYYAIGDPVILAARMQETARIGAIQITQTTFKQVSEIATYKSLGRISVKGFTDLVDIYELLGIKIGRTLNELEGQFKQRTEFVDREQEMTKIYSLLEEAKNGKGNAVGLSGEQGFGKSRVIFELIQSDTAKGCHVLLSGGFSAPKDIPLLMVKNLFQDLFGLSNLDNVEEVRKQIAPFIANIDTPYTMNAALSLIHLNPTQPEWASLEPALRRKYVFEIGTKILLIYASKSPLILIFEDVQRADSETELFLDALFSQIHRARILMITSFRNEYRDRWQGKPHYTRIPLGPLNKEGSNQLLLNMLGNDPALTEIREKLSAAAEGNPFFMQELIHSLVAEKIFVGEPKNYHLREGTSVGSLHLPESIMSIFQSKIDSLDPFLKKVLEFASVIGNKFVYSRLIQLMEFVDEQEVRSTLNKLVEAGFIYEDQLYPEPGYSFRNALTYDSAYNSLLKKNRKALHLKYFQILESSHIEDIEQLQSMSEHAFLGENWEKAFEYSVKGAGKVYELNAFTTCAKLYEKALSAAEHLPQESALLQKLMRIHYQLYYVYVPLGRFNEQFQHLEKALAIALDKKDALFESLIESAYCIHYMGYKDIHEALAHGEKAYAIATELKSKDAILIAQFALVNVKLFLGQFKELSQIVIGLEKTIGDPDYRPEYLKLPICQLARCYDAWARAFTGDYVGNEARFDKWFAESKNIREPTLSNACRFAGIAMNYYMKGDFERALELSSSALQISMSTEIIIFIPIFVSILSNICFRIGKIEEAKEYLARAIAITERIQASYISAPANATIADSLLLAGELKQAEFFCTKGMTQLKERGVITIWALVARTSAEIDLRSPNPNFEKIEEKLKEALSITTKYEALTFVGRTHLAYALFYKKKGDETKRKEELNKALAIFQNLKMAYWVEQAKKEL